MTPFFRRLTFAFKSFFAILFHGRIPDDVVAALGGATGRDTAAADVSAHTPAKADQSPAVVAKAEPTAAQMLAVLQRDGRLVDFLMEDIAAYSDVQIGSAVRNVHAGCRDAVRRYLTLEPVLGSEEGARITIEPGTSAARVKVLGNVAGQPPFHGVVRHRGWILNRSDLPSLPSTAPSVVAPAEVEVA